MFRTGLVAQVDVGSGLPLLGGGGYGRRLQSVGIVLDVGVDLTQTRLVGARVVGAEEQLTSGTQ